MHTNKLKMMSQPDFFFFSSFFYFCLLPFFWFRPNLFSPFVLSSLLHFSCNLVPSFFCFAQRFGSIHTKWIEIIQTKEHGERKNTLPMKTGLRCHHVENGGFGWPSSRYSVLSSSFYKVESRKNTQNQLLYLRYQ